MLRPKNKMTIAECLKLIKPEFVENEERIEENKKKKRRRYYKRKKEKKELKTEKDWEIRKINRQYTDLRYNLRIYLKKIITLLFIAKYRNI